MVKIGGKEYGAVLNLRAAHSYKEATGKDITEVSTIEDMTALLYACIQAWYKREKQTCPITVEDILDAVELPELSEIIASLMPAAEPSGE